MGRKPKNKSNIPDYEIDSLAKALLPAIKQLFDKEDVQKEFQSWKALKEQDKVNKHPTIQ